MQRSSFIYNTLPVVVLPLQREKTFAFSFPECEKLAPPVMPFINVSRVSLHFVFFCKNTHQLSFPSSTSVDMKGLR
jgi:hypothetical protein